MIEWMPSSQQMKQDFGKATILDCKDGGMLVNEVHLVNMCRME